MAASILVFAQSLVGAAVRHTDAGMACPDVPLCLGRWIPPFSHPLVILHFGHRVLGAPGHGSRPLGRPRGLLARREPCIRSGTRRGCRAPGFRQVLLGFLSVYYGLAVIPVSLHTLLAATLLTLLVALATLTWAPEAAAVPQGKNE